jgi:2,3-bisphosphoglycerate-independent phosphoglycerate mutase
LPQTPGSNLPLALKEGFVACSVLTQMMDERLVYDRQFFQQLHAENAMGRKCVVILLDGLGDRAAASLGNQTPLQAAETPHLDRLAQQGSCGLYHATRLGQALPSENAHFALFGYPESDFPGRGPLEALGAEIPLAPSDVAILAQIGCVRSTDDGLLVTDRGLKSSATEAESIFATISDAEFEGLRFRYVRTHRLAGILVISGGASPYVTDTDPLLVGRMMIEPEGWRHGPADAGVHRTTRALKAYLQFTQTVLGKHPVNQARRDRGEPVANAVLTQRAGRLKSVPTFRQRYGLSGLMLASGIVLPGLAKYIGMDCRPVLDTEDPARDLAERISTAQSHLRDYDFIHVHTKIPDEAAHTKDPSNKVRAIEACDRGIGASIEPLLNDPDVVVVVTSDHSTPSNGDMIHSGEAVPLLMYGDGVRRDQVDRFSEVSVAGGALSLVRGQELLLLILDTIDRAKLRGLMDTPENQPYWPGDQQPFRAEES